MFLAGEATHETLWGTVDGAWESGERAAEAALRRIGALRDEPESPAPGAEAAASHGAPRRSAGSADQLTPSTAEGADLMVERQGQRVRAA